MDEDEDGDESDEEIVLNSTSMIPDFLSAEATASKEGPEDECAMEMSSSPAGKTSKIQIEKIIKLIQSIKNSFITCKNETEYYIIVIEYE